MRLVCALKRFVEGIGLSCVFDDELINTQRLILDK